MAFGIFFSSDSIRDSGKTRLPKNIALLLKLIREMEPYTLDDTLSYDFFGFDFDFKDYDSDDAEKMSKSSSLELTSVEEGADQYFKDEETEEDIVSNSVSPDLPSAIQPSESKASIAGDESLEMLSGKVRTANESLDPTSKALSNAIQPAAKKKKLLAAVKRKAVAAKKSAKKPPGPILPLDVRRTYPRLLLNTFNSCDIRKLDEVLDKHGVDDLIAVHRYEGIKNPYGRNLTRLKGRQVVTGLWQTLFKSAPDFLFIPLETRAFYDPEYRVVVACQFTWSGTRVMDIRVASSANESVLREKLANATRYLTDEQMILDELIAQQQQMQSYSRAQHQTTAEAKVSLDSSCPTAPPSSTSTATSQMNSTRSFFYDPGELIIEASAEQRQPASFMVASTPMAQKLQMQCKGTLIVYLNEENRIYKYEFVYIAIHEAEAKA